MGRPLRVVEVARHYPEMPPFLGDETLAQYTDRLTGADGADRRPYDHDRLRQCSIGWHEECTQEPGMRWEGPYVGCECPCHEEE